MRGAHHFGTIRYTTGNPLAIFLEKHLIPWKAPRCCSFISILDETKDPSHKDMPRKLQMGIGMCWIQWPLSEIIKPYQHKETEVSSVIKKETWCRYCIGLGNCRKVEWLRQCMRYDNVMTKLVLNRHLQVLWRVLYAQFHTISMPQKIRTMQRTDISHKESSWKSNPSLFVPSPSQTSKHCLAMPIS